MQFLLSVGSYFGKRDSAPLPLNYHWQSYLTCTVWCGFLFLPMNIKTKYCTSIVCLFLLINLMKNLFDNSINENDLNLMNLLITQWMIEDFYGKYSLGYSIKKCFNGSYQWTISWNISRLMFSIIILMNYYTFPFGFVVYQMLKEKYLNKYKIERMEHNTISKLIQIENETLLNRRSVRFSDKLPTSLNRIYNIIFGFIGLFILFFIVIPIYILLRLYCRFVYQHKSKQENQTNEFNPHKLIPDYVRNVTAEMRLKLITTDYKKRNILWNIKHCILQFATFFEYIPNSLNPINLFKSLEEYFQQTYQTEYFVFGDGIGVNSYDLVKRYLQDIPPLKGFESLGWNVSTSQATFCDFTTTFLSSDDPQMKLGRDIIFQWLHSFPYNLNKNSNEVKLYLNRIVRRHVDSKPSKSQVYQSVGEVMFFLATGGQMTREERIAFIDCVQNPLIFFPDWFNFLLAGNYLERKNLNSYYTLLQAFSRHTDGPALTAAFKAAKNRKSKNEVLKLIAIVFSIAGSAAPAKLAYSVIDRIWSNQTLVKLFRENPKNFIKECARLDKVVPMVNVLSTNEISKEIQEKFKTVNQTMEIPLKTPIHCSIVNANRDEKIFVNPNEFNPHRSDLNKILVWNGVEQDILNDDPNKRPVRYCPGHDLSLDAIQFVVEQYLPILIDEPIDHFDQNEQKLISMNLHRNQFIEIDRNYYGLLDNYTKLVLTLMKLAVQETNEIPTRAIDMVKPFYSPRNQLDLFRLEMGFFMPFWDEDIPKGAKFTRKFARWLVNIRLWDFKDRFLQFKTLEQAIEWRSILFPMLPLPNVIFENILSDEILTQLAFTGSTCHYTKRLKTPIESLPNAVYVNDMTFLSNFNVRKPFQRYGAAAYFDKDFQIIGIYWSHGSLLVKKGEKHWDYVKLVWRSSTFTYVTIRDHLIVTHFIEGNTFAYATRQTLPYNHPLRWFLKPFTYHNIAINHQASVSLINERGLIHRIWAFDYEEFLKLSDSILMNYKFRLLPDYLCQTMTPNANDKTDEQWSDIYPIYHDLTAFWNIIRNYVKRFFQINYNLFDENLSLPNDPSVISFVNCLSKQLVIERVDCLKDLIDILSQLICSSTAIHELVGQASEYLLDPRFITTKLLGEQQMQDVQTYSQLLVLLIVTGLHMPGLLENWSHLIPNDVNYSHNLHSYQELRNDLKTLSNTIDIKNKIRNFPFQSMNPKFMKCSTST